MSNTKHVFPQKDCPVDFVTVFNDRAEVTRRVVAKLAAGTHELVITGLQRHVDANSFRVSGGVGNATILEVSYEVLYDETTTDLTAAEQDAKKIEAIKEKEQELQRNIERLDKERSWIEGWGQSVLHTGNHKDKDAPSPLALFTPQALSSIEQFLEFYQKQLHRIDDQKADLQKKLKETVQSRVAIERKGNTGASAERRQVTITLSVEAEAEVKLQVSYITMNASWQAAYDVRVNSNEKTLQLLYYGTITNNTLDDWIDANLALSTAAPSVGGTPPNIDTARVTFQTAIYQDSHNFSHNRNIARAERWGHYEAQNYIPDAQVQTLMDDKPTEVSVLTTKVEEAVTSTAFNIPRAATILSDNKPHKVTIGIFDFKPRFTYTVVPRKSNFAYLKATTQNTSKFPFLAGGINVFMDNNFVAHSNLRYVGPGEKFATFLGIDGGIRVEYKPEKKNTETSGYINRVSCQTFKYETVIKNNKAADIFVQVVDQLPLSSDEKIKVKLIEPIIKEPATPQVGGDIPVKINDKNNVEWRVTIPPGKEANIPFSYTIEWPNGKSVHIAN